MSIFDMSKEGQILDYFCHPLGVNSNTRSAIRGSMLPRNMLNIDSWICLLLGWAKGLSVASEKTTAENPTGHMSPILP